jgi:hypothetical protein
MFNLIMRKLPQGKKLIKRAKELGIDIQGEPIYKSASGRRKIADEYELQCRVIEAERSIRESRLWLIALIAAIASVISAVGALIVALK